MDRLSGSQLREFHQALISAFPSGASLEQMVRFGLGESLATISGGANLSDTVFELLRWAEASGKTGELLAAARNANPGNPELRAFAEQSRPPGTRFGDSTDNGNPTPLDFSTEVDKRQLRKVLIDKYPTTGELNILCADLTAVLKAGGHNVDVSVARVGGATLEETALNLISYLDRRSVLRYLIEQMRHDYPGSI